MSQHDQVAWHRLIRAAAALILLAVVTAVPFGASARDVGVVSGEISDGSHADGGAGAAVLMGDTGKDGFGGTNETAGKEKGWREAAQTPKRKKRCITAAECAAKRSYCIYQCSEDYTGEEYDQCREECGTKPCRLC
jgi:hypothetical protein